MRRVMLLLATLAAAACGGGSSSYRSGPSSPTALGLVPPSLTAPIPLAPIDDATVQMLRPELRVTNATSDQSGERTYEFQLAESPESFDVAGEGVLTITKAGVPEGGDGQTVFQLEQDLPAPKRFYWRARAVQLWAFVGPYSAPARFKTAMPPKSVLRVASLTASSSRTEVDTEVTLTAEIDNTDTPVDQLVFEWTAVKGAIMGTGPTVRWRPPRGQRTPATYDVGLTVIDRYTLVDADGRAEPRENRATASTQVRVHDSRAELTTLALTFLGDFANSNVSPETCVRNFSDNCRGKFEELEEIRDNRRIYTITGSRFSVSSISFDDPMLRAEITAPCEFTSVIKATGKIELAKGTCLLQAVYETGQWWLCVSNFRGTTTSGLRFAF